MRWFLGAAIGASIAAQAFASGLAAAGVCAPTSVAIVASRAATTAVQALFIPIVMRFLLQDGRVVSASAACRPRAPRAKPSLSRWETTGLAGAAGHGPRGTPLVGRRRARGPRRA